LRDFVQDLEHPAYDQADWYEAVELGGADVEALQRYDGLLTNGARSIGELVGRLEAGEQVMPQLAQTIQAWGRDNKQRADLLRGRRAAAISASDLLGAAPALSPGDAVAALKPGDAVTKDDQNYLVETSVSYFSGGRTTWLHRLVSGSNEGWLHVSPGGINLAWLQPFEVGADIGAATLTRDGATCRLEESGAADARVTARSGQQASGTVTTFRYACSDGGMVWIERWPDRTRAYGGSPIRPSDLEVWPAEASAGGSA
jgi:hypothetical protein